MWRGRPLSRNISKESDNAYMCENEVHHMQYQTNMYRKYLFCEFCEYVLLRMM